MRRLRRELPPYWRRFCIALCLFAVACGVILSFAPQLSGLFLFALYSVPANSLLPLPHEPGLLYFARYYEPQWIALAGCVGTAAAAAIDYPVVKTALRHPKLQRARDTRIYRISVRWLMRYPFATVVVFAATPLPVYVVRVLAPASGYPLWRYMIATMVGRFPRYYAVAWIGHMYHVPVWALALLFAVMVAALVIGSRVGDSGIGFNELDAAGEPVSLAELAAEAEPKTDSDDASERERPRATPAA